MVSGECRVHVGSIYQLDRFCMRGMGIGKSCVSICLGKHLSLRINLATISVSEAVVVLHHMFSGIGFFVKGIHYFDGKRQKKSSRGAAPHPAGLSPWTHREAKGAAAPLETPAWGQAPRPPRIYYQQLLDHHD